MVFISVIIIFICTGTLLYFSHIFIDEQRYRSFMQKYMRHFGVDITKIPSTAALPDPLKPLLVQGRLAGYLFRGLAMILSLAGIYLLRFI